MERERTAGLPTHAPCRGRGTISARGRVGSSDMARPWRSALLVLDFIMVSLVAASIWRTGGMPGNNEKLRPLESGSFGLHNAEIVDDDDRGFDRVRRVHFPKGSASPTVSREEEAPVGGMQEYLLAAGGPTDRLHLRYYVRFPEDFDFVKGGKLPGLFGGTVTGGRRSPDGTDGFSTRYMWREDGEGEVYAYLATSDDEGTSLGRGNWTFTPGRWHLIEQEVELNHPGQDDGRIRVWLDEQTVLDETGIRFRSTESLRIEGVFFSTFFGGSDETWSTPKDTWIDFAELEVSDEYLGPVVPGR